MIKRPLDHRFRELVRLSTMRILPDGRKETDFRLPDADPSARRSVATGSASTCVQRKSRLHELMREWEERLVRIERYEKSVSRATYSRTRWEAHAAQLSRCIEELRPLLPNGKDEPAARNL